MIEVWTMLAAVLHRDPEYHFSNFRPAGRQAFHWARRFHDWTDYGMD